MQPIHPAVAIGVPIRSERRVSAFAGFAFLWALGMVATAGILIARIADREPAGAVGMALFIAALAFGGAWIGNRIRKASLTVTDVAVTVRNPIRSHTVPL